MKITRIDAPLKHDGSITLWSGLATNGAENYEWFYTPRSRLSVRRQDSRMPQAWVNIDTPQGLRRRVLDAVRAAKQVF